MLRVYLDKQIISNLQKPPVGKENTYKRLLNTLKTNQKEFVLLYSMGHLSDFIRDSSDYREADLNFMAEIGIRYYINYTDGEYETYVTERLPIAAFSCRRLPSEPDFFSSRESPVYAKFRASLKMLYDTHIRFLTQVEENGINSLTPGHAKAYSKLRAIAPFNSKDITLQKFTDSFADHMKKLSSGPAEELRLFMNDILRGSKASSSPPLRELDALDFSKPTLKDELHNSTIQNFVLDLMHKNMMMKGDQQDYQMNTVPELQSLYSSLEASGLINEKPGKLKVKNMSSDGAHAALGSFSDILVTEDKKLYQKAKIIYGSLSINTLVLTAEELLTHIETISESIVNDKEQIISFCKTDVYRHLLSELKEHGHLIENYSLDSQWRYLGFFNTVDYSSQGGHYFLKLSRVTNNQPSKWLPVEIKTLINTTSKVFGSDLHGKSDFNISSETSKIELDRWKWREWLIEGMSVGLFTDSRETAHVVLVIGPFDSTLSLV